MNKNEPEYEISKLLFDAYCAELGGVDSLGLKLPTWDECLAMTNQERVFNGWRSQARLVIKWIEQHEIHDGEPLVPSNDENLKNAMTLTPPF